MGSDGHADGWLIDMAEAVRAAGSNPALWSELPAKFAEGWPGTKVLIQSCSTDGSSSLGTVHHGFDREQMLRYDAYYSDINPWVPVLQSLPVLRASPSDETLPWWTFADGEFYNDFLRLQEDVEHGAAIKLFDDPDRFAWLGFQFGHSLADTYNRAIPQALQRLAPALEAALSLNRELACGSVAGSTQQLLDLLPLPSLVVDCAGAIRVGNARAAAEVKSGGILRLDSRGCLRTVDTAATSLLIAEVRRICRAGESRAGDIPVRLPDGQVDAVLSLYPFLAGAAGTEGLSWLFAPERLAILFVRQLRSDPAPAEENLRRIFQLTAAEARLAANLAGGRSLDDAASALGIGKETARTHLHSVFLKTGTHRQSELVAVLARLMCI